MHLPWHQRCMWLRVQVRGCMGRQHILVRNYGYNKGDKGRQRGPNILSIDRMIAYLADIAS